MKILVIQQKMIGDVLTSSILFEPLKKRYLDAELHYVINSHAFPVVENHPFVDEFIFFTPEMEKSKRALYAFFKTIKAQRYDVVIDVYGKISSLLITLFSGAKTKIGYEKYYTKVLYSHAIQRHKKSIHQTTLAVENRMRLLEPLGVNYESVSPMIHLQEAEITSAKALLKDAKIDLKQPLFMISVLGSGMQKTYPFGYMAKLLDEIVLKAPKVQLLFNYIPSQKEDAQQIFNLCAPETQKRIYFNVFGKSLRAFLAITHFCKAMIGNEGGAINMAKALNKPCFTVFSPQINKESWSSEHDEKQMSVHLSDFVKHGKQERSEAKKDSASFYEKFYPDLIIPELKLFLDHLK